MKMTIVLTAVLLSAGTAMAQSPDSLPPVNKEWNNADSAKRNLGDSNMGSWKPQPPAQKQTDTAETKKPLATEKVTDRVVMKDGELFIIKNGETSKMDKEVVFPSGTVIQVDGTVKKKDGTQVKLQNGQYIEIPSAANQKKKTDKNSR